MANFGGLKRDLIAGTCDRILSGPVTSDTMLDKQRLSSHLLQDPSQ